MKGTEDNIKNSFSEFQRYIRGEMTNDEENSFRMILQDAVYSRAITEGCFSGFTLGKGAIQLVFRDKTFKKKETWKGIRIFVYGIAALVLFMIISYSGYIIIKRNFPSWYQSKMTDTSGPLAARGSSPNSGQYQEGSIYGTGSIEAEHEMDLSIVPVDTGGSYFKEIPSTAGEKSEVSLTGLRDSLIANTGDINSVNNAVMELQSEIKSDTALRAEVNDTSVKAGDHQSPQPIGGTVSYRNYIDANMKKPDTHSTGSGNEAVTVVSFLVRVTGIIDSIRVISSPGEEYALEAIRLVKEGPAWNPAERDGKVTEEEVRLRIVFR